MALRLVGKTYMLGLVAGIGIGLGIGLLLGVAAQFVPHSFSWIILFVGLLAASTMA